MIKIAYQLFWRCQPMVITKYSQSEGGYYEYWYDPDLNDWYMGPVGERLNVGMPDSPEFDEHGKKIIYTFGMLNNSEMSFWHEWLNYKGIPNELAYELIKRGLGSGYLSYFEDLFASVENEVLLFARNGAGLSKDHKQYEHIVRAATLALSNRNDIPLDLLKIIWEEAKINAYAYYTESIIDNLLSNPQVTAELLKEILTSIHDSNKIDNYRDTYAAAIYHSLQNPNITLELLISFEKYLKQKIENLSTSEPLPDDDNDLENSRLFIAYDELNDIYQHPLFLRHKIQEYGYNKEEAANLPNEWLQELVFADMPERVKNGIDKLNMGIL